MEPKLSHNSHSSKTAEKNLQEYFAEIIESNLYSFTAQSWKWDNFAQFGSLVQVESDTAIILGCVTQVQTGSLDPMRTPFTYQKTEAELMAQQPQIFEFLKTVFNVQILGYLDKNQNKNFYLLPSSPCKIHSFVRECPIDTVSSFFKEPLYLHILFKFLNQNPNFDELLLAILHRLSQQKLLTQAILDDFCQTLSLLTGNDYRRLKLFLTRVEKIA